MLVDRGHHRSARALAVTGWVGAAGALAVVLLGGYRLGWRSTGLSGAVTLWDWLELLALPVSVGVAPLLLRHRRRLTRRHLGGLTGGVAAFAVLVAAGYLVPLAWTGFRGNTAWDWIPG